MVDETGAPVLAPADPDVPKEIREERDLPLVHILTIAPSFSHTNNPNWKKFWMGWFPSTLNDRSLRALLTKWECCPPVLGIVRDINTHQSRGFAYLLTNIAEQKKVLPTIKKRIGNKNLDIEPAEAKEKGKGGKKRKNPLPQGNRGLDV